MNEVHQLVVAAFPELEPLLDLGDGIWRLMPVGPHHDVQMVVGTRAWSDGWSDELRVHVANPAWGGRTRPGGGLVWERRGTVGYVVRELLRLPAPDDPDAPHDVIPGRSVPSPWSQ